MKALLFTAALATAGLAQAQTVEMALVGADGTAKPVGTITLEQNKYGTLLTPDLRDLPPGVHGFHLHEKPSCAPATADGKTTPAGAAGGHWDPQQSKKHLGPYDDAGHKGDLPALYVSTDGTARDPVLAPRLKAEEFKGHALMVHGGGDNHSDHPQALGGGGARIACGVVQ
ncbi:superoxide dismutase family protein [Pseudomonas vranovensis]|uniref:Superoxide dismutase [Cu-Zn] n=1 Tax=Pseudomonas vranovensis TaxID=321661 RepID=A0A423E0F4_9PSED|nr:superoxide dismutase family protein [Pseudomonas vranovensis]ROL78856.1 superoxide dismutase [Pseudomonas vranovensis]